MGKIFLIVFNLEQEHLVEKEVAYNKCNQNGKSYSNIRSDRCGTWRHGLVIDLAV